MISSSIDFCVWKSTWQKRVFWQQQLLVSEFLQLKPSGWVSGLSSIEKISVFCCFFDRFFALAIAALVFQPIGDFLVILSLILGPGICVNMPKCCKQAAHFLLYYIIWCLDYIMFTRPNPWHRIFFYAHKSMEMVIRARKKNKTFYRKKNMIFIFLKKCLHTFVHTH